MDDLSTQVARSVAGDEQAFAEIYDAFATRIFDFCRSILRDDADAADAAQDTFVIAHQKLDTLRDPTKLRPWLYAIARRNSLARIEQRRRVVVNSQVADVTDERVELDGGLDERDAAALVWDAAGALSPKDRLVLDLHLRHGLAGQELADSLEVTRQNAYGLIDKMKSSLSRAAGSLLLARYNRRDCAELDALLADWDGHYDPLTRKRVARHVDDCGVCERNRAALVAPDRLFGLVPIVVAPAALRSEVMGAIIGAGDPGESSSARTESAAGPDSLEVSGMSSVKALAAVVAVAVAVAAIVLLSDGSDDSNSPSATADESPEVESSGGTASDPVSGDEDSPDSTEPSTTVVSGDESAAFVSACDLFPEAEAEAIVGADLSLIPASDEYRCSYSADPSDGRNLGALLSILPTVSDVDDLLVLKDALAPGTTEEIPGLGDYAFYHEDGALHDLQMLKNGVWVVVAVSGLVGSDDYRAAEMQIAAAAAARL